MPVFIFPRNKKNVFCCVVIPTIGTGYTLGRIINSDSFYLKILYLTSIKPSDLFPNFLNALWLKSKSRPGFDGNLSLTLMTTFFPFLGFIISTLVPNGNVLCAAVFFPCEYLSPLAVFLPTYLLW